MKLQNVSVRSRRRRIEVTSNDWLERPERNSGRLRVQAPSLPPNSKACLKRQAFLYLSMAYFVYILESEKDDTYYVGHASNLEERLNRHNQGRSVYTRSKLPWKLIYWEVFRSKGDAMRREKEIKGHKNRKYIVSLVRASRG